MEYHDPLAREKLIRAYLLKRLDGRTAEAFETHYLACQDCYEELRATELLMTGLTQSKVDCRRFQDVVVLKFSTSVQLIRQSRELQELSEGLLEQKDSKVLIDLSRVSRIDSAGLGLLMSCYSHAIRNRGMLKLLRPSPEVQKLLRLTKIDAVLEAYEDENQALQSFGAQS
jgi:anti-sigma B factor antagonist